MIILIVGLPSTGKTYIAQKLKEKLINNGKNNIVLLETDNLRRHLFQFYENIDLPFDTGVYTYENRKLVYQALFAALGILSEQHFITIITGSFGEKSMRHRVAQIAKELNSELYIIHTTCSSEVVYERIDKRKIEDNKSDAGREVYDNMKLKFEEISEEHLDINSEKDIDSIIKEVIDYVGL
jgi:predicted kinase